MNILIKGADFSEVSIGVAGIMEPTAVLTNVYLNSNFNPMYIASNELLAYNVENIKVLKVTGYESKWNHVVCSFFENEVSPGDVTFVAEEEVVTFKNSLGELKGHESTGVSESAIVTSEVLVPEGAKTLLLNCASYKSDCSAAQIS